MELKKIQKGSSVYKILNNDEKQIGILKNYREGAWWAINMEGKICFCASFKEIRAFLKTEKTNHLRTIEEILQTKGNHGLD